MKKFFAAAFIVFVSFAVFPQEKLRFGLDVCLGVPLGFAGLRNGSGFGGESRANFFDAGAQVSLKTYDFFFLDGMLGVYAGFGFGASALRVGYGGALTDIYFETAWDFCVGPAFGMDIGKLRLQGGFGFYALFAKGRNKVEYNGNYAGREVDVSRAEAIRYNALGLALTPQARFSPNSRVSFVAGMDISFTFPRKLKINYNSDFSFLYEDRYEESLVYKYGGGMRFGITHYVAIGINFGKIKKTSAEKAEEENGEQEKNREDENIKPWTPPLQFNIKR